ncbi:hypothetical protein HPB47_027656, partial [Ixodes persulcatus]
DVEDEPWRMSRAATARLILRSSLRTFLTEEPSLQCPLDEEFLVKFLRGRKYRVMDTLEVIRKYFHVRLEHTDIFDDLLPSRIMFDTIYRRHRVVTVLKEPDSLGRPIVVARLGVWNPSLCSITELFRAIVLVAEYYLLDPKTQITGIVSVVDLKGLNFTHLLHYTVSEMKKAVKLVQECYPVRIRGIYIINNPPVFELFQPALKLFMKPKLFETADAVIPIKRQRIEAARRDPPSEAATSTYSLQESMDDNDDDASFTIVSFKKNQPAGIPILFHPTSKETSFWKVNPNVLAREVLGIAQEKILSHRIAKDGSLQRSVPPCGKRTACANIPRGNRGNGNHSKTASTPKTVAYQRQEVATSVARPKDSVILRFTQDRPMPPRVYLGFTSHPVEEYF